MWRCSQAAYELILAGSTQWVYHLSVGLIFVSVRTNKRCYHRIVCSDTDDEFHERRRGEHDSASPRFDLLGIVTAYMAKTFRASASTSAKEANARSAGARASASTSAKRADARSAGGRAKQPVAWRASAVLTDRRGTAPQGPVVPCQDVVCRACYAQCAHRNGRGISLHSEDTCSSTAAHCPAHICSGVHTLKADGKRSTIRLHVFKGMGVLQKLLGQSNTVQRLQADGRPDTQGGQVSVPTPSSLVACLRCRVPDCWRSPCRCYDYVRAAHV